MQNTNFDFKSSDFNLFWTKSKNIFKVFIIILILLFILITALFTGYTVKTGEVAVISTFGAVNKISYPGLNFKWPYIQTAEFMETREKTYTFVKDTVGSQKFDERKSEKDTSLVVSTKDLQSVNIEFAVQASVSDPLKLYTAFRNLHEERFIRPRVREIVQATIAQFTIEEFISKRSEISRIILEDLKDDFEEYGIQVSNISIINHDFSDDYEVAIEKKKVAEQAVETAKAEQEKLAVEAQNKVKLAEFRLKEKELQAKANLVESSSLTPTLLEKMKIERWNGVLPMVTGKEGSFVSINPTNWNSVPKNPSPKPSTSENPQVEKP